MIVIVLIIDTSYNLSERGLHKKTNYLFNYWWMPKKKVQLVLKFYLKFCFFYYNTLAFSRQKKTS